MTARRSSRPEPLPLVPIAERGFWGGWCLGCGTALLFVLAFQITANVFF
ncbi:MAG: hypothetical protein KGJ21_09925 [Pseudomonadota bacterium]|nr:hypothetical protein [Pseudomonadota bacterium]